MKEVKDWTAYLEYLKSILLEFDTNNTPQKNQLDHIFYDGLKLLIKIYILDIKKNMPKDNLVSAVNKVEAKTKIQKSTHLDQQCLKGNDSERFTSISGMINLKGPINLA